MNFIQVSCDKSWLLLWNPLLWIVINTKHVPVLILVPLKMKIYSIFICLLVYLFVVFPNSIKLEVWDISSLLLAPVDSWGSTGGLWFPCRYYRSQYRIIFLYQSLFVLITKTINISWNLSNFSRVLLFSVILLNNYGNIQNHDILIE